MCILYLLTVFVNKGLPKSLGLHLYAVSTHLDELVLDPPPLKNPGSAYENDRYFCKTHLATLTPVLQ